MTSTSATTRPAWQRPHDRSDTILGVTALVVVPVLAFVAAIAGLPLLAPSDPSPQDGGVEALQHELAMRALTALNRPGFSGGSVLPAGGLPGR